MRIFYTICLLIGIPMAILVAGFLMITLEDFMVKHFGKPPMWVGIVSAACWIFILVSIAWQQAGKWVK